MSEVQGRILVVEDNRLNRLQLSHMLQLQGHLVTMATDGQKALDMMHAQRFDVILLDILMPELNGYQVLECMKADEKLRNIPVIVISALDEMDSIVRCIEMGAEDYLTKPYDPVLLKARLSAGLEKKRLRDQERAYMRQIQAERDKSERLLLNILPKPIADRLKQGEEIIADSFADVTILFADIADFTHLSANMTPTALVMFLNDIFSIFDRLAEEYHLEKIKTSGDSYMVVGGLPTPCEDHAEQVAEMALAMQTELGRFKVNGGHPVNVRIGMHSGQVVAGVIGTRKFSYDLWGDAVNMADRMQSHGIPGRVHVSASTYERLREKYLFEDRGEIEVKGVGAATTYLLLGKYGI